MAFGLTPLIAGKIGAKFGDAFGCGGKLAAAANPALTPENTRHIAIRPATTSEIYDFNMGMPIITAFIE